MTAPLRCQEDAARFASGETRVDELRHAAVRAAVRRLVLGDRTGALEEMYAGLSAQAPLSFRPPMAEVA